MPELMYVLKSFCFAVIIMMFMQVKIGESTIELKTEEFLQKSAISMYLQSVSSGAVLMIQNATKTTTDYLSKKMGRDQNTQKASRLNLEIKRSQSMERN